MKVDYSARGAGKTIKLVRWVLAGKSSGKNRVLVTFSLKEKKRLQHEFPDIQDNIKEWRELASHKAEASHFDEVSVDNADMVLEDIFRSRITRVSITQE